MSTKPDRKVIFKEFIVVERTNSYSGQFDVEILRSLGQEC